MKDLITGHTRLGGLLGSPVAHSISPMMHNASFRQLGIDWVYLCFETPPEKLEQVVQAMRSLDVFGFNVTMPDKVQILPYLDELSVEARLIGAVNTVKNENGRFIGYNTDGMGFLRSLTEEGVEVSDKVLSMIGAGGAASSIAIQAAVDGAKALHLIARQGKSWDNAMRITQLINRETACRADLTDLADLRQTALCLAESNVLINASSAGMTPNIDVSPIQDPSIIPAHLTVADIIYEPAETKLMRESRERGCRTLNGMYMLLYQGAEAFRIWTGQDMPVEFIKQTYFS